MVSNIKHDIGSLLIKAAFRATKEEDLRAKCYSFQLKINELIDIFPQDNDLKPAQGIYIRRFLLH